MTSQRLCLRWSVIPGQHLPGGGQYPFFVQTAQQSSGAGVRLDVALSEDAIAFAYWSHAAGAIVRPQIDSGGRHLTGRLLMHYRENRAESAVDPPFAARGVFDRKPDISGPIKPGLSLPITPEFRARKGRKARAAALGENNIHYGAEPRKTE